MQWPNDSKDFALNESVWNRAKLSQTIQSSLLFTVSVGLKPHVAIRNFNNLAVISALHIQFLCSHASRDLDLTGTIRVFIGDHSVNNLCLFPVSRLSLWVKYPIISSHGVQRVVFDLLKAKKKRPRIHRHHQCCHRSEPHFVEAACWAWAGRLVEVKTH